MDRASDYKPNVTAEFSENLGGSNLAQTIAHEGSHIEDDMALLNSYDPTTDTYNASLNFIHFDTEYSAFVTGSMVKVYNTFPKGASQQLTNYIFKAYPNAMEQVFSPSRFPQGTLPQ